MAKCNVTRAQRRWLTVEAAKQDPAEKKLRERTIANNIRSAALFIDMIPTMRTWFQPAFPVIGLAAFAGFLSEAEAKRRRDLFDAVPTRATTRRVARLVEAHDLVWRAKAIVDEVKDELGMEGPDFGPVNEGITVLTYKAVTGCDFPL
jgi:hypothetical protein